MTRPSLEPISNRRRSAGLAGALCGALLLNALPSFAQNPVPADSPAPPSDAPPVSPAPTTVVPAPVAASPFAPAAGEASPPPAAPPAVEIAPPAEPGSPPPAPTPEAKPVLPAYLMWGVGGASLIVGAAFGIAAVARENKYNDNPTLGKADSVHTDALISDIGLGMGVILLASGTIFYFVDRSPTQAAQRGPGHSARLDVSPIVGLKTQGAAVTWKF